jgi:trehalose/maltose hydrolase-like predicted phosphorylase
VAAPGRRTPRRQAGGLRGAKFPWQSGSDGREETPMQLFILPAGVWIPGCSHRQQHIGIAVAYNTWQYYQATGDLDFLVDHGPR